jgi:hypothetical protein
MRVAICFYGLVGGTEGNDGLGYKISPKIAASYYKKHIFDKNDNVDVFIHSWSVDCKDELIDIYNPKSSHFESQKKFYAWDVMKTQFLNIRDYIPIIKIFTWRTPSILKKMGRIAQSRWYSNKKSIDLARQYEKENSFKYDFIMVTRLDVAFFSDLVFDKYDSNTFYVHHRNGGPTVELYDWKDHYRNWDGVYGDLWYFSGSDNMSKFSLLFDNMSKYTTRPPYAGTAHIQSITSNIKKVFYLGQDFHLVRSFFYKT